MLAIAKTRPGPGLDAICAEVPTPKEREALIRVKACGICGSDVRLYQWNHHTLQSLDAKFPVIIGHEFSGEVAALGLDADAAGLRVGDAVAIEPNIPCGKCWYCEAGSPNLCTSLQHLGVTSHGGMAEYTVVPINSLHRMPSNLSFEEGALLETLAVAVHAARKMPVPDGSTVALFGLGPVGLLLLQVLKAWTSATVIAVGTSRSARRLRLAEMFGADHCVVADRPDAKIKVLDLTNGRGADYTFEAAGPAAALVQAIEMTRPGGQLCLLGVGDEPPVLKPYMMIRRREITITSSSGRVRSDWDKLLALAASGATSIAPIIGKRIPLGQAVDAFGELVGDRDIIKAVVEVQ